MLSPSFPNRDAWASSLQNDRLQTIKGYFNQTLYELHFLHCSTHILPRHIHPVMAKPPMCGLPREQKVWLTEEHGGGRGGGCAGNMLQVGEQRPVKPGLPDRHRVIYTHRHTHGGSASYLRPGLREESLYENVGFWARKFYSWSWIPPWIRKVLTNPHLSTATSVISCDLSLSSKVGYPSYHVGEVSITGKINALQVPPFPSPLLGHELHKWRGQFILVALIMPRSKPLAKQLLVSIYEWEGGKNRGKEES